jgi:hypothetical protein
MLGKMKLQAGHEGSLPDRLKTGRICPADRLPADQAGDTAPAECTDCAEIIGEDNDDYGSGYGMASDNRSGEDGYSGHPCEPPY